MAVSSAIIYCSDVALFLFRNEHFKWWLMRWHILPWNSQNVLLFLTLLLLYIYCNWWYMYKKGALLVHITTSYIQQSVPWSSDPVKCWAAINLVEHAQSIPIVHRYRISWWLWTKLADDGSSWLPATTPARQLFTFDPFFDAARLARWVGPSLCHVGMHGRSGKAT